MGRTYKCHRVSAILLLELNVLDESLQANHKPECPNRNCWNPEHLYIGTAQDNANDICRVQKTHCKYGHELTDDNVYLSKTGARNCKICAKERATRHYERHK